METYRYSPLPDDHSIRMLTLFQGVGDQPLVGSLNYYDMKLESHIPYEPLSYVWGCPTRSHSFECNGKLLKITQSLNDALRRLRLPNEDRRVWADQICIDQDNKGERGKQVKFMNAIYKRAKHVLVWLGSEGEENEGKAKEAFDMVQKLADEFGADLTGDSLSRRSEQDWLPIMRLTNLSWFERVWIIQEIGTVAPATLFWGKDASLDWNTLYGVCDSLTKFHHLRHDFKIDTAKIKFAFRRFVEPDRTTRHANRFSFVYELHRARHLKASDDRDRVFAFLGHYSREHSTGDPLRSLAAHYEEHPGALARVYTSVATRALRSGSAEPGLIALAAVQHVALSASTSAQRAADDYIPSWVPDWRTHTSHILAEPTSPHRASGNEGPRAESSLTIKGNQLRISGAIIDDVAAVSQPLPKAFHRAASGSAENAAVVSLWRDVYGQLPDRNGHLFSLQRPYANTTPTDGDGGAFVAYMQTLSNGGAATALRRRDAPAEGDNSAAAQDGDDARRYYRAISANEWRTQGAVYLCHALGDRAGELIAPDLRPTGQTALDAAATQNGRDGPYQEWSRSANGAASNRVFARTKKGFCVLGPKVMTEGDKVCVLWGGKMCFCLRPLERGEYLFVGECYVHGFMNGEAVMMVDKGELAETEFVVV